MQGGGRSEGKKPSLDRSRLREAEAELEASRLAAEELHHSI